MILNFHKNKCFSGKHDWKVHMPTATEYGCTVMCSKCFKQEDRHIYDPIQQEIARINLEILKVIEESKTLHDRHTAH